MSISPPKLRPLLFSGLLSGLLVGLALTAVGCGGLLTDPASRKLYRVAGATGFPANLPKVATQLTIDTPTASAGIDTQRIALARSPVSLDYLADVEWTDRVPYLVRTVLVESFENSGALRAVGAGPDGLRSDLMLKTEIRDFQAVYDSPSEAAPTPPTVLVSLSVKLVKMPERTIVARTLITAREPAATNAIPQIVVAFNGAVANAMRQVVMWTAATAALPRPRR